MLTVIFFIVFEDKLFSKSDARELVEEQGFKMTDDFELLNNESSSAIGDYYHTFTLKISEHDKQQAIQKIKRSRDYHKSQDVIDNLPYKYDRYYGPKIYWNYENSFSYVREYYQPSGHKGYAPTFRRISINKSNNELTFEDIDE